MEVGRVAPRGGERLEARGPPAGDAGEVAPADLAGDGRRVPPRQGEDAAPAVPALRWAGRLAGDLDEEARQRRAALELPGLGYFSSAENLQKFKANPLPYLTGKFTKL